MAKVTMKERKEKLASILAENVGNELTEALATEIKGVFGSQSSSTKVNEAGEVFCNYFQEYLPADEFATSKSGKIDSMSKEGKRLYRTQKSMVNKATSETIKSFKAKDISSAEMEEILDSIDSNAGHRFAIGTEVIPADYPFSV